MIYAQEGDCVTRSVGWSPHRDVNIAFGAMLITRTPADFAMSIAPTTSSYRTLGCPAIWMIFSARL